MGDGYSRGLLPWMNGGGNSGASVSGAPWEGSDSANPEAFSGVQVNPVRTAGKLPKLIVMGYARHGKDTVCEILKQVWGFNFISSSMFCAERVVFPATKFMYSSVEECYADRANHRALWFDLIHAYNVPDAARLGREIFAQYDIYCGLRNAREFEAMKAEGVFDYVIWVDALRRVSREDEKSCTVSPEMADFVINNNDTPEQLGMNVTFTIEDILKDWKAKQGRGTLPTG